MSGLQYALPNVIDVRLAVCSAECIRPACRTPLAYGHTRVYIHAEYIRHMVIQCYIPFYASVWLISECSAECSWLACRICSVGGWTRGYIMLYYVATVDRTVWKWFDVWDITANIHTSRTYLAHFAEYIWRYYSNVFHFWTGILSFWPFFNMYVCNMVSTHPDYVVGISLCIMENI
jgi:hypothetical protein